MTNDSLIFLDIDGVLNREINAPLVGSSCEQLDAAACSLLRNLCESTNSKIVIISSWRLIYSRDDIISYINEACQWDKWSELIFSETLDGDDEIDVTTRGDEIECWFDTADTKYEHAAYVILDDFPDFYGYQPVVLVDMLTGLTQDNIDLARVILEQS